MSCCQLNLQGFFQSIWMYAKHGVFHLLGYFIGVFNAVGAEHVLELSSAPPVPSPAVLAGPALESSAEIPGLLLFLQGIP